MSAVGQAASGVQRPWICHPSTKLSTNDIASGHAFCLCRQRCGFRLSAVEGAARLEQLRRAVYLSRTPIERPGWLKVLGAPRLSAGRVHKMALLSFAGVHSSAHQRS